MASQCECVSKTHLNLADGTIDNTALEDTLCFRAQFGLTKEIHHDFYISNVHKARRPAPAPHSQTSLALSIISLIPSGRPKVSRVN